MIAGDVLSPERLRVLAAVCNATKTGRLATYSDLSRATGLLHGSIQHHLNALRRDGLVTWDDGSYRTLRATVEFIPV